MTYYCDTENQELIRHKHLEPYSLNVNAKNQSENDDLDKIPDHKIHETKRKLFLIPDHISSLECNYLFNIFFLLSDYYFYTYIFNVFL
jgi:hypothetical protein